MEKIDRDPTLRKESQEANEERRPRGYECGNETNVFSNRQKSVRSDAIGAEAKNQSNDCPCSKSEKRYEKKRIYFVYVPSERSEARFGVNIRSADSAGVTGAAHF